MSDQCPFMPGDRVQSISLFAGGQSMGFVKETGDGHAICELADMKTGVRTHLVLPLSDLRATPKRRSVQGRFRPY